MPMTFSDGVWAYALTGLGVVPLLRVLLFFFHNGERPAQWFKEVRQSFASKKTWRAWSNSLLKWIGLWGLFVLIWPIATSFVLYLLIFETPVSKHLESDDLEFTCKKHDLIRKVEPIDLEAISYVIDPLKRVPGLPFGHLYDGWVKLLAQLEQGDQLWEFRTQGWISEKPDAPKYLKPRNVVSGYAIVRNQKIVEEFFCSWG